MLAHTGGLGQLVDHFSLDQRRVHVEHGQAPVAAEQVIFLEGDVDAQLLGQGEEVRAQGLGITRLAAYGNLETGLALLARGIQRHPSGQALDALDGQAVLADHSTDPLQLLRCHFAAEQRHDMACLALAVGPMLVVGLGNGRVAGLQVQRMSFGLNALQQVGGHFVVRDIDQNAEGQGAMHHRQADVENVHTARTGTPVMAAVRPGRSSPVMLIRTISRKTGLRLRLKMRILPIFRDHRALPILCRQNTARYTAQHLFRHKEPRSVNRPTPVKPDNFFLMIFRALRQRRVPLALRIASHNIFLVALALVIYACVMGLQFRQAMHEQADALGQSLTIQTANSATELLVSNDILSLNVLLGNLVKNPLVAHAAIYSVDNRMLAEAGQRPKNGLLGEAEGLYQTKITFGDVTAGQLRISLDMSQFQQPMTISLQSMGILGGILLALALALSLRLGRHITTPLLQLRVWLRDPHPYTPATDRQDEIGDLARQLHTRLAPPPPPEPEEIEEDFEDWTKSSLPQGHDKTKIATEDDEDDDAFAGLIDAEDSHAKPVAAVSDEPQYSAVLAVQLGSGSNCAACPAHA